MSDLADKPSEQSPTAHQGDFEQVQFIGDALRAGHRAILVTGRGPESVRAPEAALAGASAVTLRIGRPLPEPPELQEIIGAAVGIAGGRDIAPLAMAARLLFAEPRRTVILAIDDAQALSHRSLAYLALMTELLAPDAPVLQIVLAAGPDLLDALAQPEFDGFRDRLFVRDSRRSRLRPGGMTATLRIAHQRSWRSPQRTRRWRPGRDFVELRVPRLTRRRGSSAFAASARSASAHSSPPPSARVRRSRSCNRSLF